MAVQCVWSYQMLAQSYACNQTEKMYNSDGIATVPAPSTRQKKRPISGASPLANG